MAKKSVSNEDIFELKFDRAYSSINDLKKQINNKFTLILNNLDSSRLARRDRVAISYEKQRVNEYKREINDLFNLANEYIDMVQRYENGQKIRVSVSLDSDFIGPVLPGEYNQLVDLSNGSINGVSKPDAIVITSGKTIGDLAVEYGHGKDDWNKIFVDAKGNKLTAVTARNLKEGDVIYYIGSATVNGIFESVVDIDLTPIDPIKKGTNENTSGNLPKSNLYGEKYSSFSQLKPPVGSNGTKWEVYCPMGKYPSSNKIHWGTDFTTKRDKDGNIIVPSLGQPITSMASGVVLEKGSHNVDGEGMGNYVRILSEVDGKAVVISYHHMQENTPLQVGQIVSQGDIIGKVGATGAPQGAHLHVESEVYTPTESQQQLLNSIENKDQVSVSQSDIEAIKASGIKRNTTTYRESEYFVDKNGNLKKIATDNVIDSEYEAINNAPVNAIISQLN